MGKGNDVNDGRISNHGTNDEINSIELKSILVGFSYFECALYDSRW